MRTYQIFTCVSLPRTIVSPALHWNASANAGMFDGAAIARNFAGACGSAAHWRREEEVR